MRIINEQRAEKFSIGGRKAISRLFASFDSMRMYEFLS